MAFGVIWEGILTDIADAIRSKLGTETTYAPSEMADAIESISGGGITPTGTKQITENGIYDVASFANANVDVPSSGTTPTGTKQISITQNGTTTEDVTNYANAEITVNVPASDLMLTKLSTIEVPENTRSISVTPQSNWFNYDYLVIEIDLSLSALDWLYAGNTDLATSNNQSYTANQASDYKHVCFASVTNDTIYFLMSYFNRAGSRIDISSNGTLYLYTYSSSKTILGGSKVVVYGGTDGI